MHWLFKTMLVEEIHLPKIAVDATVIENQSIINDVKELVVYAPKIVQQAVPGQFVHIRGTKDEEGPLLRRPISISSVDIKAGTLHLIYRIIGNGTAYLANLKKFDQINCLGPLGNGFNLNCDRPLLIGGGMGIAPLIFLAQRLNPHNTKVLLGGRNKTEMFWRDKFDGLAEQIYITTDDGSLGVKGFTVNVLPEIIKANAFDRIFVCGPAIMMEAAANIAKDHHIACQVSLEKHMACGIGACLSCTCASKNSDKRKKVCTDGPVFWAEEVLG